MPPVLAHYPGISFVLPHDGLLIENTQDGKGTKYVQDVGKGGALDGLVYYSMHRPFFTPTTSDESYTGGYIHTQLPDSVNENANLGDKRCYLYRRAATCTGHRPCSCNKEDLSDVYSPVLKYKEEHHSLDPQRGEGKTAHRARTRPAHTTVHKRPFDQSIRRVEGGGQTVHPPEEMEGIEIDAVEWLRPVGQGILR